MLQIAAAERGSRVSQVILNPRCNRVRAAEHTPCGPSRVLKRLNGLAEIVERGVGVPVERLRVNFPHRERDSIILSENASRREYCLAQ